MCYDMFNLFLDVETTAFSEVCLSGAWRTDFPDTLRNPNHELFTVGFAAGRRTDMQ